MFRFSLGNCWIEWCFDTLVDLREWKKHFSLFCLEVVQTKTVWIWQSDPSLCQIQTVFVSTTSEQNILQQLPEEK